MSTRSTWSRVMTPSTGASRGVFAECGLGLTRGRAGAPLLTSLSHEDLGVFAGVFIFSRDAADCWRRLSGRRSDVQLVARRAVRSLRRLWTEQIRRHSLVTAGVLRREKRRNRRLALMLPNTGSAVILRLA